MRVWGGEVYVSGGSYSYSVLYPSVADCGGKVVVKVLIFVLGGGLHFGFERRRRALWARSAVVCA